MASRIWQGNKCLLCQTMIVSTEKPNHEKSAPHMQKLSVHNFLEGSQFEPVGTTPASGTILRSSKLALLGQECIHEFHHEMDGYCFWACCLCYAASGRLAEIPGHLSSNQHRLAYINSFYPDKRPTSVKGLTDELNRISDELRAEQSANMPEVLLLHIDSAQARQTLGLKEDKQPADTKTDAEPSSGNSRSRRRQSRSSKKRGGDEDKSSSRSEKTIEAPVEEQINAAGGISQLFRGNEGEYVVWCHMCWQTLVFPNNGPAFSTFWLMHTATEEHERFRTQRSFLDFDPTSFVPGAKPSATTDLKCAQSSKAVHGWSWKESDRTWVYEGGVYGLDYLVERYIDTDDCMSQKKDMVCELCADTFSTSKKWVQHHIFSQKHIIQFMHSTNKRLSYELSLVDSSTKRRQEIHKWLKESRYAPGVMRVFNPSLVTLQREQVLASNEGQVRGSYERRNTILSTMLTVGHEVVMGAGAGDAIAVQNSIAGCTIPLIGLEFVLEVYHGPTFRSYLCRLCPSLQPQSNLVAHLVSSGHRINYMRKRFPKFAEEIERRIAKPTSPEQQFIYDKLVSGHAAKVEAIEGRKSVDKRLNFKINRSEELIECFPRLAENNEELKPKPKRWDAKPSEVEKLKLPVGIEIKKDDKTLIPKIDKDVRVRIVSQKEIISKPPAVPSLMSRMMPPPGPMNVPPPFMMRARPPRFGFGPMGQQQPGPAARPAFSAPPPAPAPRLPSANMLNEMETVLSQLQTCGSPKREELVERLRLMLASQGIDETQLEALVGGMLPQNATPTAQPSQNTVPAAQQQTDDRTVQDMETAESDAEDEDSGEEHIDDPELWARVFGKLLRSPRIEMRKPYGPGNVEAMRDTKLSTCAISLPGVDQVAEVRSSDFPVCQWRSYVCSVCKTWETVWSLLEHLLSDQHNAKCVAQGIPIGGQCTSDNVIRYRVKMRVNSAYLEKLWPGYRRVAKAPRDQRKVETTVVPKPAPQKQDPTPLVDLTHSPPAQPVQRNEAVWKDTLSQLMSRAKGDSTALELIGNDSAPAQHLLNACQEPLIGLEQVCEVTDQDLKLHTFLCIMCASWLSESDLLAHLTSEQHRLMHMATQGIRYWDPVRQDYSNALALLGDKQMFAKVVGEMATKEGRPGITKRLRYGKLETHKQCWPDLESEESNAPTQIKVNEPKPTVQLDSGKHQSPEKKRRSSSKDRHSTRRQRRSSSRERHSSRHRSPSRDRLHRHSSSRRSSSRDRYRRKRSRSRDREHRRESSKDRTGKESSHHEASQKQSVDSKSNPEDQQALQYLRSLGVIPDIDTKSEPAKSDSRSNVAVHTSAASVTQEKTPSAASDSAGILRQLEAAQKKATHGATSSGISFQIKPKVTEPAESVMPPAAPLLEALQQAGAIAAMEEQRQPQQSTGLLGQLSSVMAQQSSSGDTTQQLLSALANSNEGTGSEKMLIKLLLEDRERQKTQQQEQSQALLNLLSETVLKTQMPPPRSATGVSAYKEELNLAGLNTTGAENELIRDAARNMMGAMGGSESAWSGSRQVQQQTITPPAAKKPRQDEGGDGKNVSQLLASLDPNLLEKLASMTPEQIAALKH